MKTKKIVEYNNVILYQSKLHGGKKKSYNLLYVRHRKQHFISHIVLFERRLVILYYYYYGISCKLPIRVGC